ncbi:hypothetical protein M3215_01405 [Bacillus cytotoxicus]|uniref:Uncharacterized protein n=1 Tax=Bacillus cytotoxicus TaxID=580165 RepID=A0ACC6A2F1_9BACI|nr:hypothetical protein [Bacillus cytotoxicus]
MNNSVTNLLKNKFILIVFILIISFHTINFTIFLFFAITVFMFWDSPNADMTTFYLPIVMPHLYPVLIGCLFLILSLFFCYLYQRFVSESILKKIVIQGIFLVFAIFIPMYLGAFEIPFFNQ